MSALAAFLLARYDEDETEIREVCSHHYDAPFSEERMLAEVHAKRQIVTASAPWTLEPWEGRHARSVGQAMTFVLRRLALPYADHPDYARGWEPVTAVPHPCLQCGHALYRHAQDGNSCADCETCDGYREEPVREAR